MSEEKKNVPLSEDELGEVAGGGVIATSVGAAPEAMEVILNSVADEPTAMEVILNSESLSPTAPTAPPKR